MKNVLADYENRKNEIGVYIEFMKLIENDSELEPIIKIKCADSNKLKKILKANTYLLMYNMVESSIRNAIQAIYDHFKRNMVEFDSLHNEIQVLILKNVKKTNPSDFQKKLNAIAKDIVLESFNPDNLTSGNIDARKIKEISKEYGFSCKTDYKTCKDGAKLIEIKNKRNDLAHGIISFADCGKDIVTSDVNTAFDECSSYLSAILTNVEKYLNNNEYLKTA